MRPPSSIWLVFEILASSLEEARPLGERPASVTLRLSKALLRLVPPSPPGRVFADRSAPFAPPPPPPPPPTAMQG